MRKSLIILLFSFLGMTQNISAENNFVKDILKNPDRAWHSKKVDASPYIKALSNNPDDGSNGIYQEKRKIFHNGVLEKVIYKFRFCGKERDKFPYEISFPEQKVGYFRKDAKDAWKKTKYLLRDKSHKYFPGCGKE